MVSKIARYEVVRRLGGGSRGEVYLAHDPDLDRLVAIRILHDGLQDNADLSARFAHQARLVARLRHPNIVAVLDVGEHEGRPFMAMEYVAGESLATLLRRTPSPPLVERLALIEQLCAGLGHAHAAGFVHRDIEPASLVVDSDGVLKILDFGIARIDSDMTQSGMFPGSLNYVAPEQVAGGPVNRQTDVFAAGAVLYEAIALEQAFPGSMATGVLNRILNEGPVPLAERAPDVDPALVQIVARALDRTPANRYQDADDMRRDIARVRRRLMEKTPGPRSPASADAGDLPAAGDEPQHSDSLIDAIERAVEEKAVQSIIVALARRPGGTETEELLQLARSRLDALRNAANAASAREEEREAGRRQSDERARRAAEVARVIHEAQKTVPRAAGVTIVDRRPVSLDEVQFTVYRPKAVRPRRRYPMLVFTHLGDRPDSPPGAPTPIEQVRDRARRKLGPAADRFRDTTIDAKLGVPREGEITLVPQVPGVDFTPGRQVFRWVDDVHEHAFDLEARAELDGRVARGRLSAYLGVLLLAEVDLAIRVDSSLPVHIADERPEPITAKAYRKIFASYSRRDLEIVNQFERYVEALGDSYLRDLRNLRAGENWQEGLLRLIDDADVFQLFWSRNAMRSPNVRREWEYALSLNRPSFVRPTYWETPLPESRAEGLPPEALRKLHFHRLGMLESREGELNPDGSRSTDDDTSRLRHAEIARALEGTEPRAAPARRPRASALNRTAYIATAATILLAASAGMLVLRGGPPADVAPAPAPAPPAISETVSGLAADRAAIERLLTRYIDAYRQKDVAGIRELDPIFTIDPPLSQWKSIDVTLSQVAIDIAPDRETAVVGARQAFSGVTAGGRPVSSTSELRWNLRKVGTTWRVVQ